MADLQRHASTCNRVTKTHSKAAAQLLTDLPYGARPGIDDRCSTFDTAQLASHCAGTAAVQSQQSAWLANVAGGSNIQGVTHDSLLGDYLHDIYGQPVALIYGALLRFYWNAVPGRRSFGVLWSCYICTVRGLRRPKALWAPSEEARMRLAGTSSGLSFPGFFVHGSSIVAPNDTGTRPGVPDFTWVEVMRVSRRENHQNHPEAMNTAEQVWFWYAAGSGIWFNVRRSLRLEGTLERSPGCRHARLHGFDSIQLLHSFADYSYEIIDCTAASATAPNAAGGPLVAWEAACPPSHVSLRVGLPPLPRFAPALTPLNGSTGVECVCRCSDDHQHLNCAKTEDRGEAVLPPATNPAANPGTTPPTVAPPSPRPLGTSVCTFSDQHHVPGGFLPFAFPPHAMLLSHPHRCVATASIESALRRPGPHWLPVFHTVHPCVSDPVPSSSAFCSDAHFYYLAEGCSDLYLHVSNGSMVVARNRADAVVQLFSRRYQVPTELAIARLVLEVQRAEGAGTGCGLDARSYLRLWIGLDACALAAQESREAVANTSAFVRQSRCVHHARAMIGFLNTWMLRLLRELRMTTAVLLHEAPKDPQGFAWKTEVFQTTAYDQESFFFQPAALLAHLRGVQPYQQPQFPWQLQQPSSWKRCELPSNARCLFCGGSTTPLAKRACLGVAT